ncbi:MAG: hypothetical protein LBT70_04185 [Holosporaceae bacterium]|nr:hypothetical protein [Holosporaceae bacterium]
MKTFMAAVFFLAALEFLSAAPAKKEEYKYLKTHGHIVNIVSKPGCNYSYVYDGPLANGKPYGKGKLEIKYANGQTYQGDCENGLRSGNGTATYPDGSTYIGHFSNGKRDGNGKLCDANGKVLQEGNWKEDQYTPSIPDQEETKVETTTDKLKEATSGITDLLKKISDKLTTGDTEDDEVNKQPESVANKLKEENAKISALLQEISDKLAKRNAEIDKQPESVANKLKRENVKINNLLQEILNKLTERDADIIDEDKLVDDYKTSDANGAASGNFWSEAFPSSSDTAPIQNPENVPSLSEDIPTLEDNNNGQSSKIPVTVAETVVTTPSSKPAPFPAQNRDKTINIFGDELDFSDFFSFI